jgi:hypothetical protein
VNFVFLHLLVQQVKKSLERIAASKKLLKSIDLEDTYGSSYENKQAKHAIETVASARAQSASASAQVIQKRTVKVCRNFL